ncbi:hypothetical protein NPIL_121711, partial [Nephila pilipes]
PPVLFHVRQTNNNRHCWNNLAPLTWQNTDQAGEDPAMIESRPGKAGGRL